MGQELRKESRDPVIDNIRRFLDEGPRDTMERCYFSIRDNHSNRNFMRAISVQDDVSFDAIFPLVAGVILTANKIECDALNYIVSKRDGTQLIKRKNNLPIFKNTDDYAPEAYLFKAGPVYVLHLNAFETGANTPGGSTDLVRFVSSHRLLRPGAIVSLGVCYGRDADTQDIGNVIIPQKLYPWSIGQKIEEKALRIKHDDFNLRLTDKFPTSKVYLRIKSFCDGTKKTSLLLPLNLDGDESSRATFAIDVFLGNMSTGEAVISSTDVKKAIRAANGNEKELGGEMEGYGLAKECIFYSGIPCFIVKAICDWGERKNIEREFQRLDIPYPPHLKNQLQAYAAFCAGLTLMELLDRERQDIFPVELLRWMGNSQRAKRRMTSTFYAVKNDVVENIQKYFGIDRHDAKQIFNQLKNHHYILESCDNSYHTNSELE